MLPVSTEFLTAARAIVRRPCAKLEIVWTDNFIDQSISVTSNDSNRISWPGQTADLNNAPTYKWAHLDGNLKADRTFHPFPDTELSAAANEVGWWGSTPCNASGVWVGTLPTLTTTFTARPVLALQITGESIYNEYPVDFQIKIYTAPNALVHTETVTGNTLMSWTKAIGDLAIYDAVKMELIISKWSKSSAVVKIVEFYTRLVETYEGNDIVSMSLLEERQIADGTLPIGNISANELDISLQNIWVVKNGVRILDPFYPSNPNSYLHALVKRNRKITAYLGFVLSGGAREYVTVGTFWSGDWTADETSGVVSTSARDRMELLRNATFSTSNLYENKTLFEIMTIVLQDAKDNIPMPDLSWSIDAALSDFVIPYAWFESKSYFETIRLIVEACAGQAYMSKEDVLIIEGPMNV